MENVLKGLQNNPKAGILFTWAGPVFVVLYSAGMLIAGLFPPTDPNASAIEVAQFFVDHQTGIAVGTILMCFGTGFLGLFIAAIAVQMRRSEMGSPLMTYAGLASAFFVAIDASLIPTLWAVCSFRAGDMPPDIVRLINDIAWFLFLFPWQLGGGIWFIAVGLVILWDKSPQPVYPRWLGWASLWFCVLTIPAGMIVFFKTGPFAFNGLLAFYVPLTSLFVWLIALTVETLKAFKRQALEQAQSDINSLQG